MQELQNRPKRALKVLPKGVVKGVWEGTPPRAVVIVTGPVQTSAGSGGGRLARVSS